jgi:IS30 family transposase
MAKVKVTEQMFKAIKQLTAGGATIPECAGYFNLAHATISRIRAAETYEDYTQYAKRNAESVEKRRKESEIKPEIKPEEPVKNPTVIKIEATHYMMQELQKTNELLTLISAKLAQIVSDLYGVKP